MSAKPCGICRGKGEIHAGGGSMVPCPGCKGTKGTRATIGELAAKGGIEGAPTVLRFEVPGEPVGKERARVFRQKNANGTVITRAVTPEKTRAYEDKIRTIAQIAVNQARWSWSNDDRFSVLLKIYCTHEGAHPDLDNVCKAVLDSGNSILWKDDRRVRGIGAAFQTPDPKNPRVEVEVRRFKKGAA